MTRTYSGGCACGAVRYSTDATPIFQNHCQCADCRRRSGTGHGSYLTFARRADLEIRGEAREWRVAGDSGNEKIHAFCPVCGAPVHLAFAAMPELIVVHAGSLDRPEQFLPHAVTYRVRRLGWDVMDPDLAAFEKMAPG